PRLAMVELRSRALGPLDHLEVGPRMVGVARRALLASYAHLARVQSALLLHEPPDLLVALQADLRHRRPGALEAVTLYAVGCPLERRMRTRQWPRRDLSRQPRRREKREDPGHAHPDDPRTPWPVSNG